MDDRGSVSFVNDFTFDDVKRFYIIKHTSSNIVRAWQAHKYERKCFYVLHGAFLINLIKIEEWENPSSKSTVINYRLSEEDKSILKIPEGFASGFINLEEDSELLIFSSSSLEESKNDDFRYDKNYFQNCNWEV